MNPRSTWLLILAALGLGAYVYISERTPSVRVDGLNGPRIAFESISAAQVTGVEILRSNAVVRLEREGDTWRIRQPVADLADRSVVEAFLRSLSRLRPRSWIPSSQLDAASGGLHAFGLDASATTLKVETGSVRLFFKLGGLAPVGGQFYFQRVGDDGVFTGDAGLLDTLPENASAWRNRALFTVPAADVERVELRGRTTFEAARTPDRMGWHLTRPIEARADGDRMEALVGILQRTRIAEFVSDAPGADLERFGLQLPEAELLLQGGSNTLVHLQIGRSPTNNPALVYVRRMAATNVVLIPAAAILPLQGTLATYRDRHLLSPVGASTRVDFSAAGRNSQLEREGTNWWVAGTSRRRARNDLVEFFLSRINALEIIDFANDVVADYSRYGLSAPARTYGFQTGTGGTNATNSSLRLLVGETGDRDTPLVFTRRSDEPGVYGIRRADIARLPESALQFRDFRFASSNAVKVVTVHQGRTRTLERSASGDWTVTAGEPGAPFSPAAEETLHRLGFMDTVPYTVPNESLYAGRIKDIGFELTLYFDSAAPLRKWRLRFVTDLGALAAALSNFDDEPTTFSTELPGDLFRDVRRDFSVFPRE
jgi:hypothetical protein